MSRRSSSLSCACACFLPVPAGPGEELDKQELAFLADFVQVGTFWVCVRIHV